MKKTLFILTVLALGFTACNKADFQDSPEQNPETIAEGPIYKVSISASLGADTKAVAYDDVSGGLASTFRTTDDICVNNIKKGLSACDGDYKDLFLHADANAKTANLVGELTFYGYSQYNVVDVNDALMLMYNTRNSVFEYNDYRKNPDNTNGQKGTLASLSDYDYATAEVTITGISGEGTGVSPYTLTTTPASFTNMQSMFKLTFSGMPDNFSEDYYNEYGIHDNGINSITIHSTKNKLVHEYNPSTNFNSCRDITITFGGFSSGSSEKYYARQANGAGNVVYAALRFLPLGAEETDEITFTMECTDEKTYIAKKTSPVGGFQNGKYYTSTIEAYPKNVNLASIGADFTARDGQVLTGTLGGSYKISIADGATVTLAGITINGGDDWEKAWAGITCEGDATLVLADGTSNLVKHFYQQFAAISVPSGKTLTIQGSGSLTADARGYGGAGIGGNSGQNYGNIIINGSSNVTAYGGVGCAGIGSGFAEHNGPSVTGGDITINTSGTVKAYGGPNAAGIGSGYGARDNDNRCGNILISKGTVEAIGGEEGAGIGTGRTGLGSTVCGTISITDGVTSVTATKGTNGVDCIGCGKNGTCGTVTIDGTTSFSFTTSTTQFSHFNSALSTTTNENDTWTLTHK